MGGRDATAGAKEPLLGGEARREAFEESGRSWNSSFEEFPASSNIMLPEKIHIFPSSYGNGSSYNKSAAMHAGESLDFEPVSTSSDPPAPSPRDQYWLTYLCLSLSRARFSLVCRGPRRERRYTARFAS